MMLLFTVNDDSGEQKTSQLVSVVTETRPEENIQKQPERTHSKSCDSCKMTK